MKLSAKLDPNNCYDYPEDALIAACGLIPAFYAEVMHDVIPHETSAEGIMGLLMQVYGFGTDIRMQGKIEENGTYVYEGDPDLEPYMQIKGMGHSVYIFPYGIVGVVVGDDQSIARLD